MKLVLQAIVVLLLGISAFGLKLTHDLDEKSNHYILLSRQEAIHAKEPGKYFYMQIKFISTNSSMPTLWRLIPVTPEPLWNCNTRITLKKSSKKTMMPQTPSVQASTNSQPSVKNSSNRPI